MNVSECATKLNETFVATKKEEILRRSLSLISRMSFGYLVGKFKEVQTTFWKMWIQSN